MKKKVLILVTIVSLFVFLMGCTSQTNGDTTDSKIKELQNKINRHEKNISELKDKVSGYELDIKYLKEEKDEYKKFIDSSIKYFNETELLELAKDQWSYNISVGKKPIQSNGTLDIDKDTFEIIYIEKQSAFQSLPLEIHNSGKISGNYFDHLKILGVEPNNTQQMDGTVIQGMIYKFQNVQKGTIIKLETSNELKKRLGLQNNTINVYVK